VNRKSVVFGCVIDTHAAVQYETRASIERIEMRVPVAAASRQQAPQASMAFNVFLGNIQKRNFAQPADALP